MNQIVKVKYKTKQGISEGYFIKTKLGYVQVNIVFGEFVQSMGEGIVSVVPVNLNIITGKIE